MASDYHIRWGSKGKPPRLESLLPDADRIVAARLIIPAFERPRGEKQVYERSPSHSRELALGAMPDGSYSLVYRVAPPFSRGEVRRMDGNEYHALVNRVAFLHFFCFPRELCSLSNGVRRYSENSTFAHKAWYSRGWPFSKNGWQYIPTTDPVDFSRTATRRFTVGGEVATGWRTDVVSSQHASRDQLTYLTQNILGITQEQLVDGAWRLAVHKNGLPR